MSKRTIALTIAFAMLALLVGCSSSAGPLHQETLLEKNWGRSVETAKYNQILNPEAGKSVPPVEGLGGQPAGYSVDKYENSFKKEMKQDSTATTAIIKK
jgi:hypothetical protein